MGWGGRQCNGCWGSICDRYSLLQKAVGMWVGDDKGA